MMWFNDQDSVFKPVLKTFLIKTRNLFLFKSNLVIFYFCTSAQNIRFLKLMIYRQSVSVLDVSQNSLCDKVACGSHHLHQI